MCVLWGVCACVGKSGGEILVLCWASFFVRMSVAFDVVCEVLGHRRAVWATWTGIMCGQVRSGKGRGGSARMYKIKRRESLQVPSPHQGGV